MTKAVTKDGLKIELQVLAAEPFFTAEEAKAANVKEGMLIMGGAKPMPPDAMPRPDHHLIVHVYDAKTKKAITDSNVSMHYQKLDKHGKPTGEAIEVPIVVMQAIGKGPQSTHYGNNVMMPAGAYVVTVIANGRKAVFRIHVSETSSEKMHM